MQAPHISGRSPIQTRLIRPAPPKPKPHRPATLPPAARFLWGPAAKPTSQPPRLLPAAIIAAAICLAFSAPPALAAELELITLTPCTNLTLAGVPLARQLPSGTAIKITPTACLWAYSDLFLRNFRGRRQVHNLDVWGQPSEDLLHYRSGPPLPKVLLDLHAANATDIHFNLREDILWWTGELVYRFCFSHPIRSCRLSSIDGRCTYVGDWEWEKVGRAVRIYASRDGRNWHLVWQSIKGRGGVTRVEAQVPPEALGANCLYIKFWGQNNNVIYDLFLSGELDLPAAERQRILTAKQPQISCSPGPAAVIAARGGQALGAKPSPPRVQRATIKRTAGRLAVYLPGGNGLCLALHDGHLAGLAEIWIRGCQIAATEPAGGIGRLSVRVMGPGQIRRPTSWEDYLRKRAQAGGKWPSCGQLPIEDVELAGARIIEATAHGNEAKILLQPPGPRLRLVELRLRPAQLSLPGAGTLTGFACHFSAKGSGPWRPIALRLDYYTPFTPGWFFVSQGWSRSEHAALSYLSACSQPLRRYYGYLQPLYYLAGPSGSFVEVLAQPEAAQAAVQQELASLHRTIIIPIHSDGRVSPILFLADTQPIRTIWQASDRYFSLCDGIARDIGRKYLGGAGPIDPLPIAWDHYAGAALAPKRRGQMPAEPYLYRLARAIPKLAKMGIGEIFVSGVLESDAGHPRDEYLPGSMCFGSICAPWRIRVAPGLGGEAGLRELCKVAHAHGIKIIIWMTPAHYSNSSPILRAHPDWIAWRADGTPVTFGYRDITGVSLRAQAFDYAVGRYRHIRAATGLDGFWMDSYCTFGLLTDFSRGHPLPQLDRTLALQRRLLEAGYTRLQIEACGPTGLPSGGHGGPEGLRELAERPEALYRFVCPTVRKLDYDVAIYFRCLANKCCPRFLPGELAIAVEEGRYRPDWPKLAAINTAYMKALPHMKRRRLLEGRGVLWTDGRGHQVIWAYQAFSWQLPPQTRAADLVTGQTTTAPTLQLKPLHVYHIQPQ